MFVKIARYLKLDCSKSNAIQYNSEIILKTRVVALHCHDAGAGKTAV